ncbi:MAG: HDOD domain-containing protein, partial [Lachnospiraceae bacterium]
MDKCVVRKSIKDAKNDQIIGYELMFENDAEGLYNSPEASTADTMAGFLMQNNDKIFSEKLTFLTVTPSLLFRNTPKIFDKDTLVIQIEDNLILHPLAAPIIKRYCEDGYKFAINNFQFTPNYFGMLEYTTYIKIDVKGKNKESLDNTVRMMKGFHKKCILTGIDLKEEYQLAKSVDADYLEGNYIAEDLLNKTSKLEFMEGNFCQLVIAVTKDETDIEEIEAIIARDAALTYMLFKMVNSAYFALRQRVSSIRQAIVTLGIGQLKRWVYLMSFNESGENGAMEEVLRLSFL